MIRELETDHFNATLYTAGVGDDEAALSRLFETYGWIRSSSWPPPRASTMAWSPENGPAPGETCSANWGSSRCAPKRKSR